MSTELAVALREEPYNFAFFQAVRLLHRLNPGAAPVGGYGDPASEVVRFRAHPSLAFPASEIQALEFPPDRPAEMSVNFMGLTGPLGVLPLFYTELIRERMRARDASVRDFLDIFHHRMISLFYLAWEKYRPAVTFETGGEDAFAQRLYCFLGMGTTGLRRRRETPDESLLYTGGMLAMHTRPAVVLERILSGYFGVPAEIEQFVGAWRRVESDAQCGLGNDRYSEELGFGVIVGDEVWDAQSGVRVVLGPLNLEQYEAFLPGGAAYRQLRSWLVFYAGMEISFELQLILRREQAPACELGATEGEGQRLGWTTWMKSQPFSRDPADVVLDLEVEAAL